MLHDYVSIDYRGHILKLLDYVNVPRDKVYLFETVAAPYVSELYRLFDSLKALNEALKKAEPLELIAITLMAWVLISFIYRAFSSFERAQTQRRFFKLLRSLPIIRGKVQKEMDKAVDTILNSRKISEKIYTLPEQGTEMVDLLRVLEAKAAEDIAISDGQSRLSGSVYLPSAAHKKFLDEVYSLFSMTNPIHSDSFPSVRQMEAEVIAMTADMLGGGPSGDPRVCGAMTSGGTDSILSAMKASRDYMCATKGISEPEMIIAESAHAAYWKAAEYFKIKLRIVPVGKDLRLSSSAVRRALSKNTAIVVASAPGYPHGVVDHVSDIARLTHRRGICLHVDACLGGFALPFLRDLNYPIPPFDFRVAGVTSISVDTHKFGMGHKGTSVVLYRHKELRQHQYTQITDWTGGLYISPGLAGSRPGALIATAWAAMVLMGRSGYREVAARIMASARAFAAGVSAIPELEVLGNPDMYVVAFRVRKGAEKRLNIYQVNDEMMARGWHMNALQNPAAVHFCFTAMHSETTVREMLVPDLRAAVAAALENPEGAKKGSAPMYGMANVTPDRGLLGEFLTVYQDTQLIP